ncbi:MAG: pitrilysin family protein [Leptospiraceae bacterium]|nr:pitrilysin family protein [Leptospiraceae bacterium]
MTVLFQKSPNSPSVSMGVWVRIGSRHETNLERGYTHFLEHMLFKGTSKRTSKQQAEEIERVGGFVNAATSREYTYFYAIVMKEELRLGLDLLSDMIFSPLLSPKDTKSESSVIIEEMKSYEDNPEEYLSDKYMQNILPNSSLGLDIIGNFDSVSNATADSIRSYYEKYYTPDRMIVAVVGDYDEKMVSDLVESYFGSFTRKSTPTPIEVSPIKSFTKHLEKRKLEQINFLLGANGFPKSIENAIYLNLFSTFFAQNTSSRLFQTIREEKGLCYNITCFSSSYTDTGIFSISCGTSKKNFAYALESIIDEIKILLKDDGIKKEELDDAKSNQKGGLSIGFELPENKMIDIAMQEFFYGNYYSYEDRVNLIERSNLERMEEIVKEIFDLDALHLSAIGDIKQAEFKNLETKI